MTLLILGIFLSRHANCINSGGSYTPAVQIHYLRSQRVMVNLFGRLTTGIRRAARLAFTTGGLHVMVLIGHRLHVPVAVPERGHRGNTPREHTHRMEGSLEGEFVIGNLIRVAPPPARLHADHIPAAAAVLVRLRHFKVVLSLVATQLGGIFEVTVDRRRQSEMEVDDD